MPQWSESEKDSLRVAIYKLLEIRAIKPVIDFGNQFLSPYFLVIKQDGSQIHFKPKTSQRVCSILMEDLRTAIKLLSSNNWMASINLKDNTPSCSLTQRE